MQTRLENTLTELVAMPSITGNAAACREALEYVMQQIAPLGLHLTTSQPNASHPWFFATTHDTLTPDILLAAHLDVVPGPTNAFVIKKQGDKLVGRGVFDMKLAAACYLEFFKTHAASLHTLNIGVLFTTDEEIGGNSMHDILATGLRPGVVFLPDGGGDWYIEARAKGFFGVELKATGKAAHGSRPWEGDNALHRIIDLTTKLRQEFPYKGKNEATLSVTSIKGGQAVNQIADFASALLDFRTFSAEDLERFKDRLFTHANSHGVEVRIAQTGDPVIFDKKHPAVTPFLATMETLIGKTPQYVDSYGGTDARYFVPYDIPCIIMEPRGGDRHAQNEWLMAEDLSAYYTLIERWALTAGRH